MYLIQESHVDLVPCSPFQERIVLYMVCPQYTCGRVSWLGMGKVQFRLKIVSEPNRTELFFSSFELNQNHNGTIRTEPT